MEFEQTEVVQIHQAVRRKGVPAARAVYGETDKSERVRRHEDAPRPTLPEDVSEALESDEPESDT